MASNNTLKDNLTLVIICYDPYIDAIKINNYFLNKNWLHCNLDVIYVTSSFDIQLNKANERCLKTNGDLSFFGRLNLALNNTHTDYVLLLLDDYIIDKTVNEDKIRDDLHFMMNNGIEYCELFNMFNRPTGHKINKLFLEVSQNNKYRINLQPSIFSKRLLCNMVSKKPETAWDAELIFMNEDFKAVRAIYSLNKSFSVVNYIDKGLATRKAVRILKKEKIWADQRKIVSQSKTLKLYLIRKFAKFVPTALKKKIKKTDTIYKG